MKTLMLPADSTEGLRRALAVLRRGGLVAFPTDTVYGLGTLAFDERAVASIFRAKDRPAERAIPVLIGSTADLGLIALNIPPMATRLANRFWPGPLTLVVQKNPGLPRTISLGPTVGVRQPDRAAALSLLRASGPLAVTSANLSGQPDPCTAAEVLAQLGGRVDLVLDGGKTRGGMPSTVVDCTGSEPVILRAGPLSLQDLRAELD
jgi:L-threonylcarbamoyladenylate synthase